MHIANILVLLLFIKGRVCRAQIVGTKIVSVVQWQVLVHRIVEMIISGAEINPSDLCN